MKNRYAPESFQTINNAYDLIALWKCLALQR